MKAAHKKNWGNLMKTLTGWQKNHNHEVAIWFAI